MDDLDDMGLEQLTAEMAWIRRLAFVLVKDASTADDVAQDTWLAAAGKVPADRPIRPWLSRVVLNLVRMRSRSDKRRSATEDAAPVADAVPTADELVDRVELQRAIVDEVLALTEPYRSTVLLHFFEGLSSAEIARRFDLPDGTVRRRLKTALDELRARLARRYERRGGLAAFVPIAGVAGPAKSTLLAAGDIAMKKLLVGIVLVLIVVGGFWLWRSRHDGGASSESGTTAATGSGAASHGTGSSAPGSAAPAVLAAKPWFVQPAAAHRRIAGRVTHGGAPLGGAVVRLGDDASREELATRVSGADGAFDFGMLPPATFVVSAEAAEKTPAAVVIAAADPSSKADQIKLELGPCRSRIHGHVVDASGGGIAKARLRGAGLGGTEAGATGEYALCIPPGDSQIVVDADGYGAINRPFHLVGEMTHDFELVPEAVLAGIVVDERGAGVAYAQVIALPQAIEQPHFLGDGRATADAEGKFRIANLHPGRFLLAASTADHGASSAKPAVAAPGAGNAEVTIVVARRAQITGKVVMGGKPVSGARMSIAGPDLLKRSAFSQTDGTFVLEGVPLGKQQLEAGTYEVLTPKTVDVSTGSVEGVTVEVAELAALSGKILRKGKPVPDAVIQTSIGPTGNSDREGNYEIRGLPPGELQVTVQSFGSIMAFAPFQKVTLIAGTETKHDIELTGAAEVQGTVVDATGNPVPNVYVLLTEPKLGDLGESMTDAKGQFRCTSMTGGGTYRVAVTPSPGARLPFKPANGPQEVAVADGDTVVTGLTVRIVFDEVSIAGRVVDDTGAPAADVHVEAIGRAGGAFPGAMLPSIRADASGAFEIANLARGTYMLHAHAGDGSEAEVHDIAAGSRDVVVKLIRPGTIEGTIAGFTREPRVHARTLTSAMRLDNDATIDGDKFSITGLAPGKYVVEALVGDESAGQSVDVKSGAITRVKLESKGRGTVEGTLTDFTSKAPLAGFSCVAALSMNGTAGDWKQVPATPQNTTDAKGMFKIAGPVGKARVMCFPSDGNYSVAGGDVDIGVNAPGRIELKAVHTEPPPSDPGFRIRGLTLPLVIAAIDPGGPAKAAGLAIGDKVVTMDGTSVAGLLPGGAMMIAWNKRPGSTLVLGIDRAGVAMTIKIVVGKPG
jgi:RNA polymerase sigma-70 factor (ECF subfamily)